MTRRSDAIEASVADFLRKVGAARPALARPHHQHYLVSLFGAIDLSDLRALDVGAGDGLYSAFMAAAGCAEVVALEPEGHGGRAGMNTALTNLVEALALDNVTVVPETLQSYCRSRRQNPFDLVLLQQSINHLDERRVVDLHRDESARAVYGGLIADLRRLTRPGGQVIVTDCARRNLFGDLGMTHPITPDIEWHKHQGPGFWTRLFARHGFRRTRLVHTHPHLGGAGKLLLDNRLASYLTLSHFQLRFEAV